MTHPRKEFSWGEIQTAIVGEGPVIENWVRIYHGDAKEAWGKSTGRSRSKSKSKSRIKITIGPSPTNPNPAPAPALDPTPAFCLRRVAYRPVYFCVSVGVRTLVPSM